jgi:hypothetical protein
MHAYKYLALLAAILSGYMAGTSALDLATATITGDDFQPGTT